MQICNTVYSLTFLLLVSVPCRADTSHLAKFILERNGTMAQCQQISDSNNLARCITTTSHLICVEKRAYPNLETNPIARQGLLQGLALRVKHELYEALLKNIQVDNLQNAGAAKSAYIAGIEAGRSNYALKGVEFSTWFVNGICDAVASMPIVSTMPVIQHKIQEPFFINDYCQYLYPKAKELIREKNWHEALEILKELHDLKFANIDAYLLATQAFIEDKQPLEAQKIAMELLNDFKDKLSSSQAEQLGDFLLECNNPDDAEKAYQLAMQKFK